MVMAGGSWATRVVATKVVATDGTGDFTDIQSAINDLPSGGGVVYIKEGTYNISSPISITTNNVALIGAGKATKISCTSNINMISASSVSGIIIDKLYLLGSTTAGTLQNGIDFSGVTESAIIDCWFKNQGNNGIYNRASSNRNIIMNNRLDACQNWCIVIDSSNNCTIVGNVVQNSPDTGIGLNAASYNTISGNSTYNNTQQGYYLLDSDYNTVTGNVSQSDGIGIYLRNSTNYNTVTGNIVMTTTSAIREFGTGVDYNTITGNIVDVAVSLVGTNSIEQHNLVA